MSTISYGLSEVSLLLSKAADLRDPAATIDGPLATVYRRRASELELEATALAAHRGVDRRVPSAA
jgi:hypothetical protein